VVQCQEEADALPPVPEGLAGFNDEVIEVNCALAEGNKALGNERLLRRVNMTKVTATKIKNFHWPQNGKGKAGAYSSAKPPEANPKGSRSR
jgi:hypothetical protein